MSMRFRQVASASVFTMDEVLSDVKFPTFQNGHRTLAAPDRSVSAVSAAVLLWVATRPSVNLLRTPHANGNC